MTPEGLVELARSSLVEGAFEAMVNLPQSWRCSGRCGRTRRESADKLMDEQWTFTSVGVDNWGRCPECPRDAHPDLVGAVCSMRGRS